MTYQHAIVFHTLTRMPQYLEEENRVNTLNATQTRLVATGAVLSLCCDVLPNEPCRGKCSILILLRSPDYHRPWHT